MTSVQWVYNQKYMYIMSLVLLFSDSGDDGIAEGNDALTMLDYPSTRNNYIDEILEVCSISFILHNFE